MTKEKHYIAVDLGAESGRVILGAVSAEKLTLSEIYRFPSCMVEENSSLRWDFAKLFSQVKTGIAKTIKQTTAKVIAELKAKDKHQARIKELEEELEVGKAHIDALFRQIEAQKGGE